MNKAVTSKEEILEVSRSIAASKGITAVNMRTVASECGIALGSLYNYFTSKAELLSTTVEAVWADIFPPIKYPKTEKYSRIFESSFGKRRRKQTTLSTVFSSMH